MIIRKRQLLLSALVLALGAAVFVNWYYTKPDKVSTGTGSPEIAEQGANLGDARYVLSSEVTANSAEEFFAGAKSKRTAAHDEAADALNNIIKDKNSPQSSAEQANEKLAELADNLADEADMENLISAKLGCKCLVIMNGGKAEIIVENGALDSISAVQIKEIAVRLAECEPDDVNITEAKY